MIVSIIAAVAENNAIGRNNTLIYHLKEDMKRFREITMGHPVIMGRKTFESFPKGPLPGRRNIVISHNTPHDKQGADWVNSVEEAIELCRKEDKVFIIGGEQIYKQALPLTDELYLTLVNDDPGDADAFFPRINFSEWIELEKISRPADEKNIYGYTFLTLLRKKSL